MTDAPKTFLALDIGSSRIGVAKADTIVRIAIPVGTITVDGTELHEIQSLIDDNKPEAIVVGYPRNQSGETTKQTVFVEKFVEKLRKIGVRVPVAFQDESLTSVVAEERLQARSQPYTKAMIDSEAAVLILEDYLEAHHGH